MTSQENNNPQQKTYQRQPSNGSFGPTAGILIVATLVFLAVNVFPNQEASTRKPPFGNTAFLNGIDRRISSSDFRGAEASALMGGVNLDFRDATMPDNEARLDVSAIMGGVDIRVPRNWTIVNHVTPIMGGVSDHTHPADANKRLVIEGTVVMGGLDIRN